MNPPDADTEPGTRGFIHAVIERYRHLLPAYRRLPDPAFVRTVLMTVSITRSLVLSARFGGWFLVARGTRLKIGPGSKVTFTPGSFLFVGFRLHTPTPTAIHLGRRATLEIEGTVEFNRGVRVFVQTTPCSKYTVARGSGITRR